MRETADETVLVLAARAPHEPLRIGRGDLGLTGTPERLYGDGELDVADGHRRPPRRRPGVQRLADLRRLTRNVVAGDGPVLLRSIEWPATTSLDEALERLGQFGPEFGGGLSNHGPMVVEALVRLGRSDAVASWVDDYVGRLEGPIAPTVDDSPSSVTWPRSGTWEQTVHRRARRRAVG